MNGIGLCFERQRVWVVYIRRQSANHTDGTTFLKRSATSYIDCLVLLKRFHEHCKMQFVQMAPEHIYKAKGSFKNVHNNVIY